ncbi:cation:proton antiporter [Sphingomonas sp.]|uniref:cation:proton antiporter domain-containing protein n=1 Tax=Sphingomonas sp. TaxID=28214 RepID=UPI0035C87606
MPFFETLLLLLFAAVVLLQVARRLGLPYPAMLALAGLLVALVPGAPTIRIDPATAVALFIAPILVDAAFDFPLTTATQLWRPLMVMACLAVLVTTAVVAWIGMAAAGLPLAAAVVLGAIVAPPDAAVATAVTGTVPLPRCTVAVLKGESLLNDATALLLFSGALMIQSAEGSAGAVGTRLALAVPGGILFGLALAWMMSRVTSYLAGTLGGNIAHHRLCPAARFPAARPRRSDRLRRGAGDARPPGPHPRPDYPPARPRPAGRPRCGTPRRAPAAYRRRARPLGRPSSCGVTARDISRRMGEDATAAE